LGLLALRKILRYFSAVCLNAPYVAVLSVLGLLDGLSKTASLEYEQSPWNRLSVRPSRVRLTQKDQVADNDF